MGREGVPLFCDSLLRNAKASPVDCQCAFFALIVGTQSDNILSEFSKKKFISGLADLSIIQKATIRAIIDERPDPFAVDLRVDSPGRCIDSKTNRALLGGRPYYSEGPKTICYGGLYLGRRESLSTNSHNFLTMSTLIPKNLLKCHASVIADPAWRNTRLWMFPASAVKSGTWTSSSSLMWHQFLRR